MAERVCYALACAFFSWIVPLSMVCVIPFALLADQVAPGWENRWSDVAMVFGAATVCGGWVFHWVSSR